MNKIGLALSGGGFRATLYHLGLIRFLHDAGVLPRVSHITGVSGGSIVAAHLGLNWGRYTGSASEFDAAAAELISFIRLDVRNRILRRFPLCFPVRWARRLLGLSNRKLTLPGLLESHYERFLFGDTSLFQLPETPQLHLLATNISEGCLCSFNREGLWMVCRDGSGRGFRIERQPISLATVPMAVAASSAFPGLFPPMELSGTDVGAPHGKFGRQAYTDGGVFDNLGVRMFRFLALDADPDRPPYDGVLVSDVGKQFQVRSADTRAGGLVRTVIRASDILMDRVWQLENENFRGTPGFAFARISDVVGHDEDPTAPHPEMQRQLPSLRTDLDRFSPMEISTLIRHGYCVARKTCRKHTELFGTDLPAGPPWDPMSDSRSTTTAGVTATAAASPVMAQSRRVPLAVTRDARRLHRAAIRRVWSSMLDWRDWASYVYVPILVPTLVLLPYLAVKYYERSQRVSQIVESLAQGSRDVEQMTRLMEGPVPPFIGERAEELPAENTVDPAGFLVLQDLRMLDLRTWKGAAATDTDSYLYGYRRLKVRKEVDNKDNHTFRTSVLATVPDAQVRFPPQQLKPRLYSRTEGQSAGGERTVNWEVGVDFQKVPPGETIDIIYEHQSPGKFLKEGAASATLTFDVELETVELTRWLLLPKGKEYSSFKLIRYPTGKPEAAENVKVVTEFLAEDSTILAFKLLALKPGYTHEITWYYR